MKKTLALALSLFLAISTACKPAPMHPLNDLAKYSLYHQT